MNLMNVYDNLPVFAQNMAFSYMGGRIQKTRFGEGFRKRFPSSNLTTDGAGTSLPLGETSGSARSSRIAT